MEKINVAELLKDCPEGMELDCTIYENVYFGGLSEDKSDEYPITVNIIDDNNNKHTAYLTKEGCWSSHPHAKCVIFPKGKTTWEGFQRPFKDGDILSYQCTGLRNRTIYIYRHHPTMNTSFYAALDGDDLELMVNHKEGYALSGYNTTARLATEEEKQKLFQAIKDNRYEWNSKTRTLEKLSEPKFKVGNWYQCTKDFYGKGVVFDKNTAYYCAIEGCLIGKYGCHIAIIKDLYDSFKLWTIQDAKDGDVLAAHECLVLFKKLDELNIKCYCTYHFMDNQRFYVDTLQNKDAFHPATEEEKKKLFDAIKDNGYNWNAETKTLIQPVFPNFHKDDWVIDKQGLIHQIENVIENVTNHTFGYDIVGGGYFNDNSDVRLWTIQDAKDGDVLVDKYNNIGIFQKCVGICWHSYIYLGSDGRLLGFNIGGSHEQTDTHPATEEEKQKLFDALKANGYHWNEEIKTLEKFPIFKVGDRIQGYGTHINHPIRVVKSLEWDRYRLDNGNYVKFGDEHAYKLLKFDITTLVPFESRVLMRSSNAREWTGTIFSHYSNNKFYGCGMCCDQCIPYEGNEHLLGKTDDCDEFYRTWEKTGD